MNGTDKIRTRNINPKIFFITFENKITKIKPGNIARNSKQPPRQAVKTERQAPRTINTKDTEIIIIMTEM